MAVSRRFVAAIVLAAVLVIAAGAYLLVRVALNPERLRVMAEARLSQAFGQPVHIGEMKIRLLPAPSVEGRDIEAGTDDEADPLVGLDAVRIVPRLSTVFSTPIEIDRVELTGLTLLARRGPDGRLLLPLPAGMPARSGGREGDSRFQIDSLVLHDGRVRFVDAASGEAAAIEDIEAVLSWGGETARLESLHAAIGSSSLSGSGEAGPDGLRLSLAWSSLGPADAEHVFRMAGVEPPAGFSIEGRQPLEMELTVSPDGKISATGRLSAERVMASGLTLSSLGTPLSVSDGKLALAPISFDVYGGKGSGKLAADIASSPVTWSLDAQADSVDIGGLVGALTSAPGKIDGTGRFNARLGGRSGQPVASTLDGTARFDVANGVIREFPLLSTIDSVIGIDQGSGPDFQFETLSATFRIAGGRASTSDLLALAGEVTLAASGSVSFDGALHFSGTATFSPEKSQELIRRVHELSGARNDRGEIELPFTASGTMAAPRFSIEMGKILGRAAVKELERQIKRGLRGIIKR